MSFLGLPLVLQLDTYDYIKQSGPWIRASVCQVLKAYFVYGIVGLIAYICWQLCATGASISFSHLGVTIGVVWGLLQISVLMGYGLVFLPQMFQ
jgi:hypothetical protein